jgi:hypothetical protein
VQQAAQQDGPRLCSAPLREELRAALRPGNDRVWQARTGRRKTRRSPPCDDFPVDGLISLGLYLAHRTGWSDQHPADGLVAEGGAPGGAAPYVTGRARLVVAARGGFVNPASKGCVAHTPGASRRSIALAYFARDLANLGRIAPRECRSLAV